MQIHTLLTGIRRAANCAIASIINYWKEQTGIEPATIGSAIHALPLSYCSNIDDTKIYTQYDGIRTRNRWIRVNAINCARGLLIYAIKYIYNLFFSNKNNAKIYFTIH